MGTNNVINFLFLTVYLSYNATAERSRPLVHLLEGRQEMFVIMSVSLHTCMIKGSLSELVCEEGESHARPYKGIDEGVGDIGRGLFDKHTCYPIRRWRRVWEEGLHVLLISCCYEANGLD